MTHKHELILLFVVAVMACTVGLRDEFIQFDSRSGLFIKEMAQNGISFFPTVYGKPYPDYPATATAISVTLARWSGEIKLITAVLPVALAVALTVLFVYLIGLTHSPDLGRWSVGLLLATYGFISMARAPVLDQFISTSATCCFYLVHSAEFYKQPHRLWWLPVAWIAGFAFRGPLGLIIPVAVTCCFYALQRRWTHLAVSCLVSLVLLALCCCALLVAAYQTGGQEFVWQVINSQVGHRLAADSQAKPIYYYFIYCLAFYAVSFPLAIFAMVAPRGAFAMAASRTLPLLLAGWIWIVLLGMSIPSAKMVRYVAAIAPASALLAAFVMVDDSCRWSRAIKMVLVYLCRLLPWLGAAGSALNLLIMPLFLPEVELSYWLPWCLLATGIAGLYACRGAKSMATKEWRAFVCGVTCLWLLLVGIEEKVYSCIERVKPFVQKVESCLDAKQSLVFYQIGPDQEDIKYAANAERMLSPQFVSKPEDLLTQQGALIVARQNRFSQLPPGIASHMEMLFTGQLGHKKCVVFRHSY